MCPLEQIIEKCKGYIHMYVYKIINNHLIILKKIDDTLTSETKIETDEFESRIIEDIKFYSMIDTKDGKHRANKLYVEKIINLDTLEEAESVKSRIGYFTDTQWYDKYEYYNYVKNEIVNIEDWLQHCDLDDDCVDSNGIEYYLTPELAYFAENKSSSVLNENTEFIYTSTEKRKMIIL